MVYAIHCAWQVFVLTLHYRYRFFYTCFMKLGPRIVLIKLIKSVNDTRTHQFQFTIFPNKWKLLSEPIQQFWNENTTHASCIACRLQINSTIRALILSKFTTTYPNYLFVYLKTLSHGGRNRLACLQRTIF